MNSLLFRIACLILPFAAGAASQSNSLDEALINAAIVNDMRAVTTALGQGADVNAKARYNMTPLLYAARNANLEMVKFLIERGADIAAEDTYYGRTAFRTAVGAGNVEMIRYLLEKGAPAGPEVLPFLLERKDLALLRTALNRASIPDAMLAASHALALKTANTEVAAAIQETLNARPGAAGSLVALSQTALDPLTGTYRQDSNAYFDGNAGLNVVVNLKDGQLTATLGTRSLMLFPTSELTFVVPENPSVDFRFVKRGNVVESVFVNRHVSRAREDTISPYVRVSGLTEAAPASTSASPEDLATAPREPVRPWPSFRGAGASGVADGQGAVGDWDVTTGRNISWKTPIPGIANASPIVWGERVFVATAISGAGNNTFRTGDYGDITPVRDASEHIFKLYALDIRTGRIAWEREAHKGVPRTTRHTKGSHASSSPVTDGRHIVVLFGTAGQLVAYDMNGLLLWKQDLGLLDSGFFFDPTVQWGHSSSPIIYQNSVIVQADRQKQSFIAAYDLANGKELWRTDREGEIPTWGSPTVAPGQSGDELITNGTKIRGYDPKTGKLRWALAPNSEVTVATPIVGPEFVYVTGGYAPVRPIYAIRPGFSGDLSLPAGSRSSPAIAWSSDREGTYIPTPVLYRGLLYTVNNNGILTVYDAQTGERAYRARVGGGGSFAASPVAADGRLYIVNEDGDVFVIRAGRQYAELARMEMNEVVMATPAISNGLIIFRTLGHVYGIGEK